MQRAALAEVAAAAEVPEAEVGTAVDGCGVLTFALPLRRMAHAFGRLEQLDAGPEVAAAMRAHPELIRGARAADTRLMRALPGWTAKGGAEGLLCAAGPGGVGVALKVEDGGMRAVEPALADVLGGSAASCRSSNAAPSRTAEARSSGRSSRCGEKSAPVL